MDRACRAAERAACAAPDDAAARLAYARELLRIGHRAAAWHEAQPARAELEVTIENPPGRVWRFEPMKTVGVAGSGVTGARFPNALLRNGDRCSRSRCS
jgi:hypothetical protein